MAWMTGPTALRHEGLGLRDAACQALGSTCVLAGQREAERTRWLDDLQISSPRARVATLRAQLAQFQRAVRRGEWERQAAVSARWATAVTSSRQLFLERAPSLVVNLSAGPTADDAAVRTALEEATEVTVYELHRGARPRPAR
jgi:hypothetical protein